ncbi:glutathione peroxidase [Pararhodobacter aggregans]|uniref:Glutathione peroxidase n=1 Tax=Pararhodobacter aggregans TaxID=404875 RepID=A0A2T7UPB4_9RHOB|nr:glutathione peroxidase [Pararhodobacter aggregans]PTX01176.1 glutathione peroxidase [Pararhodobacter aggregans]PVE46565.1 glutathione peroxidase [Pararhodobacter aggregans]
MRFWVVALLLMLALPARAFTFTAIDGATYDLDDWRGRPVLVVNTASLCGFTPQYADLQALHDRYAARGLVVLAVPSDDFRQELDDDAAVAQYCRVELGVEVPLTRITPVRGPDAHPFYRWLAQQHGVEPTWNFNKALIGPEGEFLGFWGSTTRPTSARITDLIEPLLPR